MNKIKKVLAIVMLTIVVSVPVVASEKSLYLYPNTSMSTSNVKYYSYTTTIVGKGLTGDVIWKYHCTPVWRIDSSNSIYNVSNASKFVSSGNTLIPWKEVTSKKKWYGSYKSGSRVLERYYAEGAALGYGVNVEGEVSIGASKDPYEANISVKASATIGSTYKIKYQAVAWAATKWTNSNFGYKVY